MSASASGWTANVEEPWLVDSANVVEWDHEADVIVIGFGGAGVATALQVRELGASVIAVDRFAGGGATEKSGGVVYAGGTPHQREAGYEDNAEEMFRYLKNEGTPVRDTTLRRFCEGSAADIAWLEGHGVRFGSKVYEDRIAYPPDGYYLYYTGMEKFRDWARPAPRGHRTVGKGATGGCYFSPLRDAALRAGVKLIRHAPARRLIVDAAGGVIGVDVQRIPEARQVEHLALYRKVDPYKLGNGVLAERAIAECRAFEASVPRQRLRIRARRGVVLCAGGYNYNLRLFSRYRPIVQRAYRELVRGGSMGCDGSGIELGMSVGGAISHMERLFVTKAVSPPHAFIHGVLVNREGRRFITEDAYVGNVGCAVAEQSHDGEAWLILDSATYREGVRQLLWPLSNIVSWWGMPALLNLLLGGTRRAPTLEALAGDLRIDPAALRDTVEGYNVAARDGTDAEFGKMPAHLRALGAGPYRAFNLSLRNKWGFSGTMPYGGLTVDEDSGAVMRADGSVIRGLYAAGRTAVGICSESNFSGLSIADTVFSGRRAARAAVDGVSTDLLEGAA
ncbi:FAD-binding protein [Sinimarinibacterium flocculans]|uniref:FAD-binding protein n=1 Tax=Sinimarinibacterium flocculans TaxID=985250 RepID=UPI0024925410|nr:FAD-binding protein [Sinimarinibacterium flocculans]